MRILEKTERRLGERLFLKGDRCIGPKCAQVRRAYAPGAHGAKKGGRRGRSASEFGDLMREKQKLRFFYGLDDSDIKRYVERASQKQGVFDAHLIRMIESRLDIVVRRLGFAPSGRAARQTVTHGHVTVNGRSVRAPSYQTKKGDVIGLSESSARMPSFISVSERLRAAHPPAWLTVDPEHKTGTVSGIPGREGSGVMFDVVKVKEFYSR